MSFFKVFQGLFYCVLFIFFLNFFLDFGDKLFLLFPMNFLYLSLRTYDLMRLLTYCAFTGFIKFVLIKLFYFFLQIHLICLFVKNQHSLVFLIAIRSYWESIRLFVNYSCCCSNTTWLLHLLLIHSLSELKVHFFGISF